MRVPHLVVVYDSVLNSVFESQVLIPALRHSDREIIIVSFERTIPPISQQSQLHKKYPTIKFMYLRRLPFILPFLLWWDVYRLKKLLKSYKSFYLQARGPLAAFVVQKINNAGCISSIIQIRGLLAEEYAYTIVNKTIISTLRYRILKRLEKRAYSFNSSCVIYEVVSLALKEYVIKHFATNASCITITQADIPCTYDKIVCQQWRKQVRQHLGIAEQKFVYCYNGSAKAWQCPELVIQFFLKKLSESSNSFLLILTYEKEVFKNLLHQHGVVENDFCVLFVPPEEIYRYLAASDCGLLFRKPHIINWVSRPTKMLEYQAVGLPIEHNNTVAYLAEKT